VLGAVLGCRHRRSQRYVLGVVRVAKVRSPWRLLRPFLLAGAVTATWLTLSSSAATADTSTDSGSLLGGVTSSVSSLTAPLAAATLPIETKAPAIPAAPAAAPAGILQPLIGSVATAADQLVAAVPVVKSAVPPGVVSAVADPLARGADNSMAGLVEVAVPPLVQAAPILEPVLQPVASLVPAAPLPAALPRVVDAPGSLPETLVLDSTALPTVSDAPVLAVPAPAEPVVADVAGSSGPLLAPGDPAASAPVELLQQAATGAPLAEDPSAPPFPEPAAPGSGTGSAASPSGASGAAAWLPEFDLELPLSGTYPVRGTSEHAPSPVSFDPGSSPD
jgi:hypothetical protein